MLYYRAVCSGDTTTRVRISTNTGSYHPGVPLGVQQKIIRLENLIIESQGTIQMNTLLMSLTLVVGSVGVVAVTGALFWCLKNRSRLRNWKY
jgi:hypothetical protein